MAPKRERLLDIDRAKGLAILLVVMGHIVAREPPAGNEWYSMLKDLIYLFHMPLFMFLAGFVMCYTLPAMQSWLDYRTYVARKTTRLIAAFVLFGSLMIAGKVLLKDVMVVDNGASGWIEAFVRMLILPTESQASSLWFIYVLAAYYILVPGLLKSARGRVQWLLVLGLGVHFLPLPEYFALHRVAEYLFVFALGMTASLHLKEYLSLVDRYRFVWLGIFAASFALTFVGVPQPAAKLVTGILSIPALHALVRMPPLSRAELLAVWGINSFAIYLMNTMAIGFAKGVLLKFTSWDGLNFLFFVPLLLASGMIVPIVLSTRMLSRIPIFKSILAG